MWTIIKFLVAVFVVAIVVTSVVIPEDTPVADLYRKYISQVVPAGKRVWSFIQQEWDRIVNEQQSGSSSSGIPSSGPDEPPTSPTSSASLSSPSSSCLSERQRLFEEFICYAVRAGEEPYISEHLPLSQEECMADTRRLRIGIAALKGRIGVQNC